MIVSLTTVFQATVYDDLHMGDFIAVVVNFTNQKTEHAEGGVRSNDDHMSPPRTKPKTVVVTGPACLHMDELTQSYQTPPW